MLSKMIFFYSENILSGWNIFSLFSFGFPRTDESRKEQMFISYILFLYLLLVCTKFSYVLVSDIMIYFVIERESGASAMLPWGTNIHETQYIRLSHSI